MKALSVSLLLISLLGCTSHSPWQTQIYQERPLPEFHWDNATVYFVMIDRFKNGNPKNDHNFGRFNDNVPDFATFHGGDLKGLTQVVQSGYFNDLGVNALWITSPLEQIHGWTKGADKSFPHFGYHGYYPLDFTSIDPNFGTEEELAQFIEEAHNKGLRVIMDVVMNHAGYLTLQDMHDFSIGSWSGDPIQPHWRPGPGEDWGYWENYLDLSPNAKDSWAKWWSPDWVRSYLPGYPKPGTSETLLSSAGLPDFRTEETDHVSLPPFLAQKKPELLGEEQGAPKDFLISWLTSWVRKYGIDGFRIDTARHVELEVWEELISEAGKAFKEWKSDHPEKVLDDQDFWVTGEFWGHGVQKDAPFTKGFDSVINFHFQVNADRSIDDFTRLESLYSRYAQEINSDPEFNVLSYLSSHDTLIFYNTPMAINQFRVRGRNATKERQIKAGTILLMAPGGIQIFYGDEVAREYQFYTSSDPTQGTRSDFPWEKTEGDVHQHWQILGQFRRLHPCISSGKHQALQVSKDLYLFKRLQGDDQVLIGITQQESIKLNLADHWPVGTVLEDYYTGKEWIVEEHLLTIPVGSTGTLLLHKQNPVKL